VGLLPKRMLPKSSAAIYANRTARVEFDRETFGARLQYQWQESKRKSHQIDLLNISFSNLFSIDNNFINQLDTIQLLAFNSEFISSTSWNFTYTGQESVSQKYYSFFNSNLEIGGNLQSVFTNSFGTINNRDLSELFEVPVYQFARLEVDYRYYVRPSRDYLFVVRFNGGYILPYGLSEFEGDNGSLRLPPFSRFFFIGGTNDLRAWPAYRAGGGIEQVSSYEEGSNSSFAIGTLKLLTNLEYRFPIYSVFKGAVFVDAGNIWLSGGLQNDESGFTFNNLGRDLYIGTGFGLRMDLDFFVIRFDTGLRVRDPGYWSQGDEWVIATKPVLPNLTYNIALGYPF
jgi:outer membrane protein insertion porin family